MVAELPLPPDLERLHALFLALNGVHSFLLSQHIQVCGGVHLLALQTSVAGLLGAAIRLVEVYFYSSPDDDSPFSSAILHMKPWSRSALPGRQAYLMLLCMRRRPGAM